MAGGEGPWGRVDDEPPRPPPKTPRRRLWLWLGLLAAVGVCVWLLTRAFPGAVSSGEDWAWVGWSVAMVALVSSRLLTPRTIRWGRTARYAGIWLGIFGVLAIGVTYQRELGGVAQRVRMQFSGGYPVATEEHEMVVSQDGEGGFVVMGKVNGQLVRFLVDTGATDTVLSPADARRLGIDVGALKYDQTAETANGTGYGAAFVADSLAVGSIGFADVPMLVNQAPMSNSLLGMTFLKRLESFQVKDGKLYLKSRQ